MKASRGRPAIASALLPGGLDARSKTYTKRMVFDTFWILRRRKIQNVPTAASSGRPCALSAAPRRPPREPLGALGAPDAALRELQSALAHLMMTALRHPLIDFHYLPFKKWPKKNSRAFRSVFESKKASSVSLTGSPFSFISYFFFLIDLKHSGRVHFSTKVQQFLE